MFMLLIWKLPAVDTGSATAGLVLVGTGNKGTFNDFQMPAVNYTLPTDNSVNEGIHAVPATTTATANGLRQAGFNI